jgi:hypothetical protein
MVMVFIFIRMVFHMKDSIKMIKKMDLVNMYGQNSVITSVGGQRVNNMD